MIPAETPKFAIVMMNKKEVFGGVREPDPDRINRAIRALADAVVGMGDMSACELAAVYAGFLRNGVSALSSVDPALGASFYSTVVISADRMLEQDGIKSPLIIASDPALGL